MTELDTLLAEMEAATKTVTLDDLGSAQRKAAERVIAKVVGERKEIKKLTIHRFADNRYVTLYVEAGLPNDEGTLAAIFARDEAHVTVGINGGVKSIAR